MWWTAEKWQRGLPSWEVTYRARFPSCNSADTQSLVGGERCKLGLISVLWPIVNRQQYIQRVVVYLRSALNTSIITQCWFPKNKQYLYQSVYSINDNNSNDDRESAFSIVITIFRYYSVVTERFYANLFKIEM